MSGPRSKRRGPSTVTKDDLKDFIRQETRRELRAALADLRGEQHEQKIYGGKPFAQGTAELPHELQDFGARLHRAVSDELQRFAATGFACSDLSDEDCQEKFAPSKRAANWPAPAGRIPDICWPDVQAHALRLSNLPEPANLEYQRDCIPEPKANDYSEGRYSVLEMSGQSVSTYRRSDVEFSSEKHRRFSYISLLEEMEDAAQGRGKLRPFTAAVSLLSTHADAAAEQQLKPAVPRAVVTNRVRRHVGARNSGHVLLEDVQLQRTRWGKGMCLKELTIKSRLHGFMAQLVVNNYFDYVMCLILICNAITLGAQVERAARGDYADNGFRLMERIFCVLFCWELAVRLYVFRARFFYDANWQWNSFDASIVGLHVTEELLDLVISLQGGGSVADVSRNMKQVKMLRFLRLLRTLRILRIVRFVQELSNIAYLIVGSLWSFVWVTGLLFLMTYIVGTFVTQLVADWSQEHAGERFYEQRVLMRRSWGSIGTSVLSLYQGISGGVDWKEIVEPLSNINDGGIFPAFFSLYIAFAVLVMLNLVTGVFVESAHTLSRRDKKMELMRKMHMVLEVADIGPEGQITWEEFEKQLELPEVVAFFEAINMDLKEAETVFQLLDTVGEGAVTAEDFVLGGLRLQGPAKAIDLAKMQLENTLATQAILQKLGCLCSGVQDLLQQARPSGSSPYISLSIPQQELMATVRSNMTAPTALPASSTFVENCDPDHSHEPLSLPEVANRDAGTTDQEDEDGFADARSRHGAMVKVKSHRHLGGFAAANSNQPLRVGGGAASPSDRRRQRLFSSEGVESC